jgi:SAM-dependent methyltransferase
MATLAQQVSAAAHKALPHANPLSSAQLASLVSSLVEQVPGTVIDIGCGPGAFSIDLARRCSAVITAIDVNADFLDRAQRDALRHRLIGSIDFRQEAARNFTAKRFDAIVCVGSSQAFGLPSEALEICASMLDTNGTLVFADLVWAAPPCVEFLEFLGIEGSYYWHESEPALQFDRAGLVINRQELASRSSWRTYEDAVLRGRLTFAEGRESSEAEHVRSSAQGWASAYDQYGQHCLGFAAYVASKPERASPRQKITPGTGAP